MHLFDSLEKTRAIVWLHYFGKYCTIRPVGNFDHVQMAFVECFHPWLETWWAKAMLGNCWVWARIY